MQFSFPFAVVVLSLSLTRYHSSEALSCVTPACWMDDHNLYTVHLGRKIGISLVEKFSSDHTF